MKAHTTQTKKQTGTQYQVQADFGRAARCNQLICDAFHQHLFNLREAHLSSRLFARVYDVLRSDELHAVGSRTMASGNLGLLEGFDFNKRKPLHRIFNGSFDVRINRRKGECVVDVPNFDPVRHLRWEGRITHIKILAAAAVLDFRSLKFLPIAQESGFLDIQQLVGATLPLAFPARTRRPLLVVMGMEFYQFVGSRYFLRQQDGAKSLTIVKTDR